MLEQLRQATIRAELNISNQRVNAKIRDAQLQKIPYMLVVGKQEVAHRTVSVRLRTEESLGQMPIEQFVQLAKLAIVEKRRI